MKCKDCSSEKVFRCRAWPGRERMARTLLPVYYFRCTDCHSRAAYVTWQATKAFLMRLALAAGVALAVWLGLGIVFAMLG